VGAENEEYWGALFKTITSFPKVDVEVGGRLGYAYPFEMDRRVVAYLEYVHVLDQ
jgi:hypothetical protein